MKTKKAAKKIKDNEKRKRRGRPPKKNKGGRPPKFKTVKEMQEQIDAYLNSCGWQKIGDRQVFIPATVTGLAVALDTNRDTLVNYGKKNKFSDTIKRAKAYCEASLEQGALNGTLNPTFSIFSAKNNFKWVDKSEVEKTIKKEFKPIEIIVKRK